jgi:hypothetical protein
MIKLANMSRRMRLSNGPEGEDQSPGTTGCASNVDLLGDFGEFRPNNSMFAAYLIGYSAVNGRPAERSSELGCRPQAKG